MLRLGDIAPDFEAETTHGRIASFHEFIGNSWVILFSHPEDFTPVCTTELGMVARLDAEWKKRNTKVIGLSCDTLESHEAWLNDINKTQNTTVNFPLIVDANRSVATKYGMLDSMEHDPTNVQLSTGLPLTVRTVFVIDPQKKVRLTIAYPASCGRNFDEILRVLDSLQTTDKHKVTTPVNWKVGEECIVPPTVSTEQAKADFGQVREVLPYLRYVQPTQK